jgi:hypothetical protein
MPILMPHRSLYLRQRAGQPNITPPVLSGPVEIGLSPVVTPGVWTGGSQRLRYSLIRSPGSVEVLAGVTQAAIEAYVYTDADIGPTLQLSEWPEHQIGFAVPSNQVVFDDAGYLDSVSIVHTGQPGDTSGAGLTLADANTTVDQWAATYGGDPVGLVLAAPAATNRPVWTAAGGAGGRGILEFDGSDNVLRDAAVTKGSVWTEVELGYVGHVVASGSGVDVVIGYSTLMRIESGAASGVAQATTGGTGGATSTYTTSEGTTDRHWSFDWVMGTPQQNVRVAGVVEDTDGGSTASKTDGLYVSVGATDAGGAASRVNVQAGYISTRKLTADERLHLRALLSFLTGVAC